MSRPQTLCQQSRIRPAERWSLWLPTPPTQQSLCHGEKPPALPDQGPAWGPGWGRERCPVGAWKVQGWGVSVTLAWFLDTPVPAQPQTGLPLSSVPHWPLSVLGALYPLTESDKQLHEKGHSGG